MSATEREHVMPPRPLMPWTMVLCAGLCASCGLVLNVAADVLLGERAAPVILLMARCGCGVHRIGSVLHASCAMEAMAVCRGSRPRGGGGRVRWLGDRGAARFEGIG